ncbi:lipocalin-like domain-containing protein [Lentzea sp. NPDC060358]|uniref:lipocalin-like domain-containing protein n=1 Tax=Lentzea sp. NPDC060358 TaxID=3347103 RepID=UPI0036489FC7
MRRPVRTGVTVSALLALVAGLAGPATGAAREGKPSRNELAGTWRMVSAVSDPGGPAERRPYGDNPDGMVTFSENGTFVEVFQDTTIPRFASGERVGTPEENAAVVGRSLGQFGTYEVDRRGEYSSNVIIGSTWPNRNGQRWQTPVLRFIRAGDQLTEVLEAPGVPRLEIRFVRVP